MKSTKPQAKKIAITQLLNIQQNLPQGLSVSVYLCAIKRFIFVKPKRLCLENGLVFRPT